MARQFVNVLRMIPNKGVLLACSDLYKEHAARARAHKFWHGAASGALAGATAALLTYPLDLARSRMAGLLKQRGDFNRYHRAGLSGTLAIIRREEGLRGLFAGLSPTLLGAFPYEGLKFGTYDALKHSGLAGEGGGGSLWKDVRRAGGDGGAPRHLPERYGASMQVQAPTASRPSTRARSTATSR